MMRIRQGLLMTGLVLVLAAGSPSVTFGAEAAAPAAAAADAAAAKDAVAAGETSPQTDPAATNLASGYPAAAAVLPPMPTVPASLQDVSVLTKYMNEVKAYMEAAQKYIDGTTNDLNKIIEQRNLAINNANETIKAYNAFLDAHQSQ